ncbi:hypothetical protein [Pseudomonas rhizoryzae]|nr:hypothetical protein [Pseudomonas rhizoryzae]
MDKSRKDKIKMLGMTLAVMIVGLIALFLEVMFELSTPGAG